MMSDDPTGRVHIPNLTKAPQWEPVTGEPGPTDRLAVEGGWLYRTSTEEGVALCFVPGPAGGKQRS